MPTLIKRASYKWDDGAVEYDTREEAIAGRFANELFMLLMKSNFESFWRGQLRTWIQENKEELRRILVAESLWYVGYGAENVD